jgi:hypothetical protein
MEHIGMKLKKHLSFASLRKALSACFYKIPEHRQASKVDYSIHDALMSGFACMHFQDSSLLQFQKRLEKKHHKSNLHTLFGIKKIPESTQLRDITNAVDGKYFNYFFDEYFHQLQRGKHLLQFQLLPGLYYIPMDGTEYFSSTAISCKKCLKTKSKTKKGKIPEEIDEERYHHDEDESGIRYSHKAVQIAIVHPDIRQVIPLMPEEICNTDGATKQDCEVNAAKRLIPKLRSAHPQLGMIMGGDDLFSRQPMIEAILAERMHYIFVAKPESHTYLVEWLNAYPKLNELEIVDAKKDIRHVYKWMNDVPLHGKEDAIRVNYFEYQMHTKNKKGKGIIGYQNSWVTDLEVTKENVETLVKGGRCRWKIENECFNTLKNQGYCLDHSYGHGENLSFNFYILTLIAFAFHQVFELTDKLYQICRKELGSKKNLWEHFRAYLKLFVFDTWEALLSFTLNPEHYLPDKMPAPS